MSEISEQVLASSKTDSRQGRHSLKNVTLIWLAMLVLTVATWFIGETGASSKATIAFVLFTVVAKGHWIISDFMELKHCALKWKLVMYGWMLVVLMVIAVFTFQSGS